MKREPVGIYFGNTNAARLKKNALVICTVSNHIITGEETTAEERQNSFGEMITLETKLKKFLYATLYRTIILQGARFCNNYGADK